MKKPSDPPATSESLVDDIVGLGDRSIRKNYYPQLRRRLAELERFRMLLGQSTDAVFLFDIPSGQLVDVNNAACRFTQRDREALLALPIWAVGLLEQEQVASMPETEERHSWIPQQVQLRRLDGTLLPVEIGLTLVVFEGKRHGIIVARDISERLAVELALRSSEQRYRTLVDNIGLGIALVDTNNTLLTSNFSTVAANSERMRKFFETHCARGAGARLPACEDCAAARVSKSHRIETSTVCLRESSEGSLWMSVRAFPLPDQHGEYGGFIEVIEDVTERMRAEEEREKLEEKLRHAQKLESLGVLAGGIAHDFNNLLVGVLGNIGLAAMSLAANSAERSHLQAAEVAARRAADLTRQLLAYAGRGRLDPLPTNLNGLVDEMIDLLRLSVSKRATITCQLTADLPAVNADPTQLRQVVMNLITNASDAIGDKDGTIAVRTGRVSVDAAFLRETVGNDKLAEGQYVFFEVSDNGSGMSPQTLSKVFDPFFTTKFTGRGLGLAAVIGIVRGHHGAVRVRSSLGVGTSFMVVLPGLPGTHKEAPKPPPSASGWKTTGKALVIDDELVVRTVTQRVLESAGFEVTTAVDGMEGLQVFSKTPAEFAIVVVDMSMPRMSGDQVFAAIRRHRVDIPVILCSGFDADVMTGSLWTPPVRFIAKPFDPRELIGAARDLLTARTPPHPGD